MKRLHGGRIQTKAARREITRRMAKEHGRRSYFTDRDYLWLARWKSK